MILYIDYYYLETVPILVQFVILLTLSFFYLKASAVVDLEEEDDDLFQSARLEPEMSKFVGNTNGFSSRCTKKPYLLFYEFQLLSFCGIVIVHGLQSN